MSEWETKPLGDIATLRFGERITKENDRGDLYPVYGGGGESFRTYKYNFENIIVVSRFAISKECVRKVEGRFWLLDSGFTCEGTGKLCDEYLNYYLLHNQPLIYNTSRGVAQRNVEIKDFLLLPVFYPSDTYEQRRIAAVLTAADEAIAASRSLVEKYAAVKQGLMHDLLSGRVRLAGFTGDWEQLKIGNLLDFKNGLNKGKEFFGTGIPIVNYMDVYTRPSIRAASLEGRVNLSKNEIKRFEVKKGDVFFTRTSETVNEVGYASVLLDDVEDGVFSGFVLRGRPKNDKLDIYYCQYCFSTQEIRRAIIVGATCTTRALTSGTYLSTIPILLPKPDEQRAIAEVIMAADERLTAERERLMKLEDIKLGLMDDLLTNRVSTDKLQGGI